MTTITIESTPADPDPLAVTGDAVLCTCDEGPDGSASTSIIGCAVHGAHDHAIVLSIEIGGRTHKFTTSEDAEHSAEIRIERGRFKSASGPGLIGLADDATALQIAGWIEDTYGDGPFYAADLADRIHRMEWKR